MILAIHTKLPGRARFKIKNLYRCPQLKNFLESRLSRHKDILDVSANILTGNILLHFNSATDHQTIAALIEETLEGFDISFENPGESNPVAHSSSQTVAHVQQPYTETSKLVRKAKEKIGRLLQQFDKQPTRPWHLLKEDTVLDLVQSGKGFGISNETYKDRLKRYGPNTLPRSDPRSKWSIFVNQFLSLPVALLGGAAGLSILMGGLIDAVVIMGVVAANAFIGYVTESQAEKTIQALKNVVHPSAEVIRDGAARLVSVEDVVIGDHLVLKPGAYIAADSRIMESSHLSVDESVLTGESMPVFKKTRELKLESVPLADRNNMALHGHTGYRRRRSLHCCCDGSKHRDGTASDSASGDHQAGNTDRKTA